MNCRLCGSQHTSVIFPGDDVGDLNPEHFSVTKSPLIKCEVSRCDDCGIVFNSSSVEDLSLYEDVVDAGYEDTSAERKLEFSRALQRLSKRHGIQFEGRRLLDVGCMSGVLLEAARDLGCSTLDGVEPSQWAADVARGKGFGVFTGFLGDMPASDTRYDIITCFDVIEHVPDPAGFIAQMRERLSDEGVLVITTPDIETAYAKLLGRRYWFIEMMHLFYFSPSSLSALLEKAGLSVVVSRKHDKVLRFGYFMNRLGGLFGPLHPLFDLIGRIPGLTNVVFGFYAGQMLLVARNSGGSS